MSNNNSILSIKQFAEIAGVSKQNIYNQLNGRLKPYVQVVDGVKMLKKSALEVFYSEKSSQVDSQPVNNQLNDNFDEKILSILEKNVEILNKQLETKDKQIEELNKRLADITNVVQQQQILLDQQQKLTLIEKTEDIKEPTELEEPQQKKSFWNRFFNN